MAELWGLLRLVRFVFLACAILYFSSQFFETTEEAELSCPGKEVTVNVIDASSADYPSAQPWKSPRIKSATCEQRSCELGEVVSRRLLQGPSQQVIPRQPSPPPLQQIQAPAQLPPASTPPLPLLRPSSKSPTLPVPPLPAPQSQPSLPPPRESPPLSALTPSPAPSSAPIPIPAPSPAPSLEDPIDLERQAVLYFMSALTADPTGVFKQWKNIINPNHCNWYGIRCGEVGENVGRVISLSLPERKLEGVLTKYIRHFTYMETLDLGGNNLTGSIPEEIGALKHLKILRLNGNSFWGPLPSNLSSCVDIEEFNVEGCSFMGEIPTWLGWSPALRSVHMGGNKFSGNVPISLLNCTSLRFLNISSNNLTGSVDSTVGNLVHLQSYLDVSHNRLSGLITSTLGNLQDLIGLNLSNNAFTGTIPESIGNCSKLQSLDFSDNKLSGAIPPSLSLLSNLKHTLNISHNNILGLIPSSFGMLHNLTKLDLSFNNLSGPVPETLANLSSLVFLNLSFNQLSGPLPDNGIFVSLSSSSFLGNLNLCGRLAARPCPSNINSQPLPTYHDHQRRGGPTLITVIGAAAEGAATIIFLALLLRYLVHRRQPVQSETVTLFSKYFKALNLSAEDVHAATSVITTPNGSFSRSLSGTIRRAVGFSSIEKAVLPDGTVFAVLQCSIAKLGKKDRSRLDAAMLELSKIRHRNLVRLMGYTKNPSSLSMLLEFMPNGSLDLHLHPPGHHTCLLNWNERLRIIMGVTAGLVHLHQETCGDPIVHCDLKAANVLLDSDMEPKLVNYGVASLFKRRSSGDSTVTAWVGSPGYVPPGDHPLKSCFMKIVCNTVQSAWGTI
uniref:non-specific serine/threonine protein kinase n=1 Tax=Physcomitrium patens TaxID=3218 RepID=A0A7I4ECL8_PHYPA